MTKLPTDLSGKELVKILSKIASLSNARRAVTWFSVVNHPLLAWLFPIIEIFASELSGQSSTRQELRSNNCSRSDDLLHQAKFRARLKEPFSLSIFFCNCKIEYRRASGRGGHPGTYTSTGIT